MYKDTPTKCRQGSPVIPKVNGGRTSRNKSRKVALNIVTLGAKPEMDRVLPAGIVNATADLLVASGVENRGFGVSCLTRLGFFWKKYNGQTLPI